MDYKNEALRIISSSIEIISSMMSLSQSESDFIDKFSEHLSSLKTKIEKDEINMDEKQRMTGLFRWLGEHNTIVNQYRNLYDNIYELEMLFTKRNK